MKTRERIVHAALELFNEHGERNITTNHIAAHIDISPGNLYYHFRNKQEILREIFAIYSNELLERFTPVEAQEESLVMLKRYLDSIFTLMWKFRFFYANLPEILHRDPILHERYLEVQTKMQENIAAIFALFIERKLLELTKEEARLLVTSTHLVATNWLSYRAAMSKDTKITEQVIHQGVLQLISIVKPYTTPLGTEQVKLIEEGIKAMHAS
ncbi:TetR/AcrR family transcriptional regulator [Vibrio sp. JC009]|uniref:TetR/AcrR family transcriptional regulator n=1 Tax=Vibrio sp. JC009 TaxID=2912314 RepID=UPI0023B0432F|nr:TetR/AcrR family transcriptional regulator [Vibrio sp. JC009]WED22040.1 TetR/AcrR family transcriptional regulator [Vibrio sp. JC009]